MTAQPRVQRVQGRGLPYLLSVPPGEDRGPLPVHVFLHGYDEAAPRPIDDALMRHGPLRPGNPPTALADFIVVAPQLPAAGDSWYRYAEPVAEILQQVLEEHEGDADRAYLSGFSFGGNGVFDLGLRQADAWAALWAVDPTRVPADDPVPPVWLSSGEVSRRQEAGFRRRLELEPLTGGKPADRVYTDEGLDHVGTARAAYGDRRIYQWLLRHRRGSLSRPQS